MIKVALYLQFVSCAACSRIAFKGESEECDSGVTDWYANCPLTVQVVVIAGWIVGGVKATTATG